MLAVRGYYKIDEPSPPLGSNEQLVLVMNLCAITGPDDLPQSGSIVSNHFGISLTTSHANGTTLVVNGQEDPSNGSFFSVTRPVAPLEEFDFAVGTLVTLPNEPWFSGGGRDLQSSVSVGLSVIVQQIPN